MCEKWILQERPLSQAILNFMIYNIILNIECFIFNLSPIVIAEMQHITYNEFLQIVLGNEFMKRHGLAPLKSGYSNAYFGEGTIPEQYDPRVSNEFATAAYRFGHSLIPAKYDVPFNRRGQPIQSFRQKSVFFQPTEFREDGANNGDISKLTK